MKVAELIAALQEMPQEVEVHYAYNYGDHWRTTVAPTVQTVREGVVAHSGYHDMDKLIGQYDEENHVGTREVVVLR